MSRQIKRTGEGQVGCIFSAVAFIVVALIAWHAVPVKVRTAEFYDYMVEQAEGAGNSEARVIKKRLLKKAVELELPITEKTLHVTKGADRIRIKTAYEIPLEFPGYTYVWDFDYDIDTPIFYF